MPDMIYFDGKSTPIAVVRRRLKTEGVPDLYIEKFLATAEPAGGSAEFFDESKIKRASDGKFATKAGSKSADAAVAEKIVKTASGSIALVGQAWSSIRNSTVVQVAGRELSRMIDMSPIEKPDPKKFRGFFGRVGHAINIASTGAVRRVAAVLPFLSPATLAINMPSWTGQDPHYQKLQREYGKGTANLIVASGYALQTVASTYAFGHVLSFAPMAVHAAISKSKYSFVAKMMFPKFMKQWTAEFTAKQTIKAAKYLGVCAAIATGSAAASFLSQEGDGGRDIFTGIKKISQGLSQISRLPGEFVAMGAFAAARLAFGSQRRSELERELVGPDEAKRKRAEQKLARMSAEFADDNYPTLPPEKIEALGKQFANYFDTQYFMKIFTDGEFLLKFGDHLKSLGVTDEAIDKTNKAYIASLKRE